MGKSCFICQEFRLHTSNSSLLLPTHAQVQRKAFSSSGQIFTAWITFFRSRVLNIDMDILGCLTADLVIIHPTITVYTHLPIINAHLIVSHLQLGNMASNSTPSSLVVERWYKITLLSSIIVVLFSGHSWSNRQLIGRLLISIFPHSLRIGLSTQSS